MKFHDQNQPEIRHVSRTQARRYACPNCGAAPGAACFRYNGKPRVSCHQERHDAAIDDGLRDGGWAVVRPVVTAHFPRPLPPRR